MMKRYLKILGHSIALLVVSPLALISAIESWISPRSTGFFRFGGDLMSVMPGLPGAYLRRAYYCWTLESCSPVCQISFGTVFAHRQAVVEDSVYLGTYALLGRVVLRKGCLIGSRASIISGGAQHRRSAEGEWLPADPENLPCIEVSEHAWLGEACVVAADVGRGSMIAAGAVVTHTVPCNVMVAGNPARFVKKLDESETAGSEKRDLDHSNKAHPIHESRLPKEELIHE